MRVRASFEYTAAVRYGPVLSYVLASEGEIHEIVPTSADALVLLSPRAEAKAKPYMKAKIIIKNGLFYEESPRPPEGLPANMFFLGLLSGTLGSPRLDLLLRVVGGGKNAEAIEAGYSEAKGDK
jgi:Pyruvate/2-oxoacid:ferredoxin oxidoreductase gamma subunit